LVAELPVGPALGYQREDALLLSGQPGKTLIAEQVLAFAETVQDRRRDGRVEQALAAADQPDRIHQLATANLLQDVTGGAGHDRREERLVVGEGGQHQDARLGALGPDLTGRLDPAAVREANVHDDDVR